DCLHIGNERYVTVKSYKGQPRVDIRQYQSFGNKIYPTKTGIHLSGAQFVNLIDSVKQIDTDVTKILNYEKEKFKYNIGDEIYVTSSDGFALVHIRLYYKNEDMDLALPTKVGIALRFQEWDTLLKLIEDVQERIKLL